MSFAEAYLEKVSLDPRIVRQLPGTNLSMVIAIPASNEPGILHTLTALRNCFPTRGDTEIIIALNSSESAPAEVISQNLQTEEDIRQLIQTNQNQKFRILLTNRTGISVKKAGAGFARKIAMDHALSRFDQLNKPEGVIISLDADTLCETNYLSAVEEHFENNPASRACSVYFEHPIEGNEYPASVYSGITQYELHLRYYIEGLRYAGHPHAYHTVGSAFCLRAGVYASQGGMNKRSAGEDFYFLQKIIPLGNYHELNTTCLIPSPRPSGRVAFGTGPVVRKFLTGEIDSLDSYHPRVFHDLREFLSGIPLLYRGTEKETLAIYKSLPGSIQKNLGDEFFYKLKEIRDNSSREETFHKRFYHWFNMFRTLKYINFAHKEFYPRIIVQKAASEFLEKTIPTGKPGRDAKELLFRFRKIQRESRWQA